MSLMEPCRPLRWLRERTVGLRCEARVVSSAIASVSCAQSTGVPPRSIRPQVPSTRMTSPASCTSRAATVEKRRPVFTTSTRTRAGPTEAGRRKCEVTVRGSRSPSSARIAAIATDIT